MLNLLLGGVVCVCCVCIGWTMRVRYRKRVDVMGDLQTLLVFIEEQIRYDMAPLPRIFERFASAHPRSAVAAALLTYPEVGEVALPRGQWAEIRELLLSLGRSDMTGQAARLAFVKERVRLLDEDARLEYAAKGRLYAKLWCVLGVGLMIWMV